MNSMKTGSVTAVDGQKNKLDKKYNAESTSKLVHNFMRKKKRHYARKNASVTQQDDRLALYTDWQTKL